MLGSDFQHTVHVTLYDHVHSQHVKQPVARSFCLAQSVRACVWFCGLLLLRNTSDTSDTSDTS